MRKIIYKYLSSYYLVKKNTFLRIDTEETISSLTLVDELILIFRLTKKEIKWYLKSWIRKQNKGFEFNGWWAPKNIFRFSSQIFSSTIATDLIEVMPMSEPSGLLFNGEWYRPTERREYLNELERIVDTMTVLEFPFIYE